jgi:GNAT superfamily N-acetyltransferase
MQSLVFRETLPSDIEGLFPICARTRENRISKEGLASIGITAESIAKQMTGGRVKGWVCSTRQPSSNSVAAMRTGEVLVLAVLPDYERRGIGTYLLSRVVEWLRSVGSDTVWLAASAEPRIRWLPNGKKQQMAMKKLHPNRTGAD